MPGSSRRRRLAVRPGQRDRASERRQNREVVSSVWMCAGRHWHVLCVRRAHRAPNTVNRWPRRLDVSAKVDGSSEVNGRE